ncbi:MAG: TonB-dependent receptor [Gemmatimonadetes bacterium]|nr:TonB-dependent receptor [Gemmatimonadota bacterium]
MTVCRLIVAMAMVGAVVGAGPVSAQERSDTGKVHTLDSLVVSGAPVRAAPPPVSTITVDPATLRRAQATDPWDLVRRATGIEVHEQGQGPGFASNVVLRGFSSDHSSDALLVLDGVPINLPIHGHVEGYNDWSPLAAPAVGAMRVVHGPASAMYGDFNFGGVIEVSSPSDLTATSGQLGVSSFGDVTGWVRTGRRSRKSGFFTSALGEREEGWRDNSSYWLGSGSLRGWHQAGKGRLEGGLLLYGSDWRSPGYLSIEQYNDGDLTAAIDTSDGGNAQRLIATGRYTTFTSTGAGVEVSGWVQGVRTHLFLTVPEDGVQQQEEELDRRVAFGAQARMGWNGSAGEFTAGVAGRLDLSKYDLYQTLDRAVEDTTTLNNGQYLSGSLFGRWQKFAWSKVAFDAGARLDVIQYGSQDLQVENAPMARATSVQVSPKFGARYILSSKAALLASVARGFRGAPGVVTDPSLPPLSLWGVEVGTQLVFGGFTADLALFRMDVANERIQDPVTLLILDTGGSYRQGVSARLGWQASRRLSLQGNVTANNARIKESDPPVTPVAALVGGTVQLDPTILFHLEPPSPGDPVPGVMDYNASIGGEYRIASRAMVGARVRIGGPFTPIGEPDVQTQPYAVLDLGGQVPLGRSGPMLDIALQNVTGTKFPEIRSSGFINPGAPVVLRVAVSFDTP